MKNALWARFWMLTGLVTLAFGGQARASLHIWSGGGSDHLWSNAANWAGNVAPTTGESGGTIVFFGTNTTSTMDIAGLTVDLIQFSGTGNVISASGSTFLGVNGGSLTTNIQNDQGTNIIGCPLKFAVGAAIETDVLGGDLTFSGSLSSAVGSLGFILTKGNGSGGTTTFAGGNNTYTGTTSVFYGTLQLNTSGSTAIPGALIIGKTTDAAGQAEVVLLQSIEIADGSAVTVNDSGALDLNGFYDTIGALTVHGGRVSFNLGTSLTASSVSITDGSIDVTTGSLITGSSLSMTGGTIITDVAGIVKLGGDVTATSSANSGAKISGNISLNAATRTFTVNPGSLVPDLAVTGVISNGSVASGLKKAGTGTLDLLGNQGNTYSGTTTVDKGVLRMNTTNGYIIPAGLVIGNNVDPAASATVREFAQSNDIAHTSAVTVNSSGVLDLAGGTDTIASLSGSGSVTMGTSAFFTVSGSTSTTFSGAITGSGSGTFTKSGTSTLTLSGGYTFAGATQVSGGELDLNMPTGHNLDWTGTLTIGVGVGTSETSRVVLLQPGVLNPAVPIDVKSDGLLNLNGKGYPTGLNATGAGDLTLGALTLPLTIGPSIPSTIGTTGVLNISGSTLALTVSGTPTENAYVLATYSLLIGSFANVTGLPSGYTFSMAYDNGTGPNHIAIVGPQSVVTGPPSSVLTNSVVLNGTINTVGKTMSWYFEYGFSTTFFEKKSAVMNGLKSTTAQAVKATVTGVNGGSFYYYRLVAFDNGGPVFGAPHSFSTTGPLVSTNGSGPVSALSATVTGSVNPLGLATTAWFEYGQTTAYGSKTATQAIGTSSVTVTVPLKGLVYNKVYHFRLVAKNSSGSTTGHDAVFYTLNIAPPVILGQPVSKLSFLGGVSFFSVMAVEGSALPTDTVQTYQWRKNGVAIKGATLASYALLSTTLANAGTYSVVVSNSAGSTTSAGAELGVVQSLTKTLHLSFGTSTTLTATAAGNGLFFSWTKNGVLLPAETARTLPLTALQSDDDGLYECFVQNASGSRDIGGVTLAVFDSPPLILTPVGMPDGIVGGPYSFQVPVNLAPGVAPTSFSVGGLPTGLTYSTATGLISGRITATVPALGKDFTVTMKATNSQGSSPVASATLHVQPFTALVAGPYSGLVQRDTLPVSQPNINGGLGGNISMTMTGAGSYTGTLVLGAASYKLIGLFNAVPSSSVVTAVTTIVRAAPLHNLVLSMTVVGGVLTGTVSDATALFVSVTLSGDINVWSTASNQSPYMGTYTAGIKLADSIKVGTANAANIVYPQGGGYATVSITSGGVVTWVGKMGDGTSPATTFTTTIALHGRFPVHLMLDGNTGAANGFIAASVDTLNVNNGLHLLDGPLEWHKTAIMGSTNKTYKDIPLVNLTVAGGVYVKPMASTPVLGISPSTAPGSNNAKLVFTDGGLTSIASAPPVTGTNATQGNSLANLPLRVTTSNTADFTASGGNPATVTLVINTTTGAITGTFSLLDAGVPRKVNYYGLLVPRLSVNQGVGFFVMPELPAATTSLNLSGLVILKP